MPIVPGNLPPLGDWSIPGGVDGPLDQSWQTPEAIEQQLRTSAKFDRRKAKKAAAKAAYEAEYQETLKRFRDRINDG